MSLPTWRHIHCSMGSPQIRHLLTGTTAVLAASSLGGCATGLHHGVRPLRPLELATAPYDGTVTQSLDGSLTYERGCLLLRADPSGYVLPIWPVGSIFNGTAVTFHAPGKASQPIMIEQQVRLDGRPLAWNQLPSYAPFEYNCPAEPFLVSGVRPAD